MGNHKRSEKKYVLFKLGKGIGESQILRVYATNYKEASKKMGVSPYELRTYGHIEKVKK